MFQSILIISVFLRVSSGQTINDPTSYDFIIVGAGSGGATLAGRLSENENFNVLLLEAGEKPPSLTEIPLLLARYTTGTAINWNYTMEPQEEACLGSVDNRCPYFMGRVLGGSSQINAMLYVRGNKIDYDLWEKDGAEGWAYDDVLPYFKKAEGLTIDNSIIDEAYHGRKGPLTVSNNSFTTEVLTAYINAIKEQGYANLDYNGKSQEGFGVSQATIRNGYRCSTEKAYLQPAYKRSNLKIITGAYVTKVNIQGRKAVGVYYIKDNGARNATYYVTATKEVILSAGAIKTPQILMLSGIGPKQHLKDMGIKLVKDLPVGQNLQDHVATYGVIYSTNAEKVPTFTEIFKALSQNEYDTPETLTGILSTSGLVEVMGFIKSEYEKIQGDYNDVQLYVLSVLDPQAAFNEKIQKFYKENYDKKALLMVHTILHPKSKGNVTLRSTTPTDPPFIRMNYYTDPDDLEVMLFAVKKAHEILLNTTAFKILQPKLLGPLPGCETFTLASDDYFKCVIRLSAVSLYHASCTCKMGGFDDLTTVVDSNLRVKRISGLRVVDASIMPRIISGNTNVPVIMIAEKAADMIKKDYATTG